MMNLMQAVATAIKMAKNNNEHSPNNDGVEYSVVDTETDRIVLSYTNRAIAQWDYSDNDWESMDFEILALEILDALGIEVDDSEIYEVQAE